MILPKVPFAYDPTNEAQTRAALEREDKLNRKAGTDVEIGAQKLILKSPNGTRWNIIIADDGTISGDAL